MGLKDSFFSNRSQYFYSTIINFLPSKRRFHYICQRQLSIEGWGESIRLSLTTEGSKGLPMTPLNFQGVTKVAVWHGNML